MRNRTIVIALAFLALASASPLRAGDVNLSIGTYSHVIPIEVPAFHGLEPKLALTYSSQGGNGFAGVGWSLSGFSAIEWGRTGETQWGGAPDKYFLDGQELIACQTGSVSPSCTTGGTHSTKIESYLRIKFDSAANTWTVWGKDGTKTTFSPTLILGSYTVRYGQTSTVDTYGNTVTYGWACQGGDCFPDTISYNGYTISVFREARPDILSFAEGYGLGTTQYRLRSVIVQLGTTPIRGYKLTYTTSLVTSRSLVASVQQYGKDLVHSSGAISSGTSLPAQSFTYQADSLAHTFQGVTQPAPPPTLEDVGWRNLIGTEAAGSTVTKTAQTWEWDAGASSTRAIGSGDGYVEFAYTPGGSKMIGLNDADNGIEYQELNYAMDIATPTLFIYENGTGVFNAGNILSTGDVLRIEISGGVVRYKRNGTVVWTSTQTPTYPLLVDTSINQAGGTFSNVKIQGSLIDVPSAMSSPIVGDFDGDGRSDLLRFGPGGVVRVSLGTASGGFAAPTTWLASSSFSQPFLGDFNGDGKTDIGNYDGDYFWVALSTGSGFASPVAWGHSGSMYGEDGLGHACFGSATIMAGDFNGDGLTDVFCRTPTDNHFIVGINGGLGFSFSVWNTSPCQGPLGVADFNGDGKSDLYCIDANSNALSAFQSNGSTFLTPATLYTGSSYCYYTQYVIGDLNGDGRADLVCKATGDVMLSSGLLFVDQGSFGGWCFTGTAFIGDFDGSGGEVLCDNPGTPSNDIEVRKWQGNTLTAAQTWKANWCGLVPLAGDFNGDGKTDLYCNGNANALAVAGTAGVRADLLITNANGLGGTTQLAWMPSTSFANTNNPPPSFAVTSATTTDGRGGSSAITYTYSGGAFDRYNRQPLGFSYAKTTLPCLSGESTCPSADTWFRQDIASAGKVSSMVRRDQAGHALTQKTYVYSTNGATVPRTSLLTEDWTYTFDGTGASCSSYPCANGKRTQSANQYDAYGNPTRNDFSGDYDATGDDTATTWSYRPNTTAYIVDRVAEEKHFGPGGTTLVKSRAFWYDGQNGTDSPPTKGSVTKSLDWLVPGSRWVSTSMSYDSYGNLTSVTDPTNRATTTGYDSTYHVFPISVTNAAADSETSTWDPVCGLPTQQTNVAGQVATMQSDALCRPTRTDLPLGAFTARAYVQFGDPANQAIIDYSPSATPEDNSGDDFTARYFDGFGRTYRAVKKGPSSNHNIFVEAAYDSRGQVASRTAPYYASDPAYTTTFTYDALGRLTRTTHPDANVVTKSYGIWTEETHDEHGHVTGAQFDAYGRVIVQEQHLSGQTLQTHSTYDAMGRLIGMTDAAGNAWSWTFDWLGRNVSRSDPDSGTWTFEFDDAARMTAQTDAKLQRTDFTYDAAGRLATKGNSGGTVTITRSEPRTGYFNTGQVTTVASPGTTLKTDYDALGRPVKQVRTLDSIDYTAERRYDAGGRLRGITYPDGDIIGNISDPLTYDAAGRLKAIPAITSEILYDAAGRATRQTNTNGTITTKTYSAERGFLTHLATTGAATIQDLVYSPDAAGMITQVTSPFANESWTYAYDELHRLTSAATQPSGPNSQTFQYDTVGNVTYNSLIGSYTYPSPGSPRPHGPSAVAGDSMTYDNNGNLTAGRSRTIQWNADNLAVAINATQMSYDAFGERIKKATGSSASLYPFGDDYEITNGVITKYLSVDGLGVVAKRVGTQTFWIHADRLGSIQAITDAVGAPAQRRTYRPYGDKIADATSHTESRGYIGERQDTDTGLTYLHARYYDPAFGVFISPDPSSPIDPGVGTNRYSYGFENPLDATDHSGLYSDGPGEGQVCMPIGTSSTGDGSVGGIDISNKPTTFILCTRFPSGSDSVSGILYSPIASFLADIFAERQERREARQHPQPSPAPPPAASPAPTPPEPPEPPPPPCTGGSRCSKTLTGVPVTLEEPLRMMHPDYSNIEVVMVPPYTSVTMTNRSDGSTEFTTSNPVRFYFTGMIPLGRASYFRFSPTGDLTDNNMRYTGFLAFVPDREAASQSSQAFLRLFMPNMSEYVVPARRTVDSLGH